MIRMIFAIWGRIFWRFRWVDEKPDPLPRDPVWWIERAGLGEVWALVRAIGAPCRILVHASVPAAGKRLWAARALGAVFADSPRALAERVVDAHRRGLQVLLVADELPTPGVIEVVRQARATLVPVEILRTDRLRLSRPQSALEAWEPTLRLHLHAGPPIEAAAVDARKLERCRMELRSRALDRHPALEAHLARWIVANLRRRFFEPLFTDAYQNGKRLTGGMILGTAWVLADWIKTHIPGPRVGIVLPPGLGATLANLACILADKTPVNLNFTMGRAANAKAIAAAELTHTLTAGAVVAKLGDFPWTAERTDLSELLAGMGKATLLGRVVRAFFSPTRTILGELGVPASGGHREAGLLFTSGSSGDPKGVPLSHRNIIANVLQVDSVFPRDEIPLILGCLPIFHSFGFTVTLWWPLMGGPRVVTYVSPIDSAKIVSVIREYGVSMLVTTPTFLRSVLRKTGPGDLDSLALVVTGAEKLPPALAEEFESKTGVPVCEGYGMTEACPVISSNLTDAVAAAAGGRLPGRIPGTVGRPLYGIQVRVCHPESGAELPPADSGMLCFHGANIFQGYLNDPERSALVLRDGWYVSGDIGHLNEEGFLVIDGRLSRFSKIGGEMVPHGTVEMHLFDILRGGGELGLAVVGTRDPQKGEALVVLSDREIDPEVVRKGMAAKGLPNLWIPRQFVRVEAVPTLASGKLDLRRCQELAEKANPDISQA